MQVAVALGSLKQLLHDEQGPPRSYDLEGYGKVAHETESMSGFIQKGE